MNKKSIQGEFSVTRPEPSAPIHNKNKDKLQKLAFPMRVKLNLLVKTDHLNQSSLIDTIKTILLPQWNLFVRVSVVQGETAAGE